MRPFISVIMPTYNGAAFVGDALKSVRDQDAEDLELIVVDDGSSDRTLEVVKSFAKALPIRVLCSGKKRNWVAATNIGLREASGEWTSFLHQDDIWLRDRVATLRPAMASTDAVLVLHNAVFIDPHGRRLGSWTCPLREGTVPAHEFLEHLLIQNFIAIPSPTFRRSAALESGGLDEALWFSADWDLWLRLGAMGPVCFIGKKLTGFRLHPGSQTFARRLRPGEWQEQLGTVLSRHLTGWVAEANRKELVVRVAQASISVNSWLAALSRGAPVKHSGLVLPLLALGPAGWRRYLRDSRIVQRVVARLKAQHLGGAGAEREQSPSRRVVAE